MDSSSLWALFYSSSSAWSESVLPMNLSLHMLSPRTVRIDGEVNRPEQPVPSGAEEVADNISSHGTAA